MTTTCNLIAWIHCKPKILQVHLDELLEKRHLHVGKVINYHE